MKKQTSLFLALVVASALAITGCSKAETSDSATSASCAKADLATVASGMLTIATGEPAYYPWILDDAPETGTGFEGAVAYAVAKQLGFSNDEVTWVRTTFDGAVAPGVKNFDFNLQQYSITDERKQTVSFSDPYYTTNQAIVGYADSAAASATTVAELQGLKFGVQSGTTSLEFLNTVVMPTNEPYVYDDNAAAKAALEAKQIDAIVVDLPTAFYISAVEIEGTKVIGQFPAGEGTVADQFGLVFDLDNPLVECVNVALAALKESGELATIEQTWLSDKTSAPVISLG